MMYSSVLIVRLAAFTAVEDMGRAVEIASLGMLMVFAALALLCVFLGLLPRVLGVVNSVWPETDEQRVASDAATQLDDDDNVLAAIVFVLHSETRGQG